jgi:predicted amidohydrolase
MRPVRVAIIQTGSNPDTPLELASRVESRLRELPADVSLAILPELWSLSHLGESLPEMARFSPSILESLSNQARRRIHAIHCGSLPWLEQGFLYNRSFFIGEEGRVIARYDQTHFLPSVREDSPFRAGKDPSPFLWKSAVWGTAIGRDLLYPEFIRSLTLAGVRILLVSASWPKNRLAEWRALLLARSIENQVFTLGCNRHGNSMGIGPDGTLLAEAGEGQETLIFEIDPMETERVRKACPLSEGRRRDLYSILSSMA